MPPASAISNSPVLSASTTASRHAAPPFECTWQTGGTGAAWVHASGELDLAASPQLRQTLRDAQLDAHLVVLDLRELTFMDSSGSHVILDAARDARLEGNSVVLVRGPTQVDRVFGLTGASDQVLIVDLDPTEPSHALLGPAA